MTVKIHVFRIEEGSDLLKSIEKYVTEKGIKCGWVAVIGALEKARVGTWVEGKYEIHEIKGPLEIAPCIGIISQAEGKVHLHLHANLADKEGKSYGGHVFEGCIVKPTAEVVIFEFLEMKLERKYDEVRKFMFLNVEVVKV